VADRTTGLVDVKPLVYVAGPYTHPEPVLNTRAACLLADHLVSVGAAVIVPHLSLLWHAISPASVDDWYARDLDVLAHCHAVALLPGESTGADAEVAYARGRDIPVYSTDQPIAMNLLRQFILEWRP
jgi:hypothetical protein